jgi:hypothetical protein
MKKNLLAITFYVLIVFITTSGTDDIQSSGAPIGSTGAPGELSCGKVGCHTGNNGENNINTGNGVLSIVSDKNISDYTPGESYDITVMLEESGIERFGFSLTALDSNNNKAGELIVTDNLRTQLLEGAHQFSGRNYITYRYIGTNPYESGKGLWKFTWKAPDVDAGPITFYSAAVSADNDGTDKGDLVYTQILSTKADPVYVNDIPASTATFSAYPNPATNLLQITTNNTINETLTFTLYDLNGKLIKQFNNSNSLNKNGVSSLNISELNEGIYLLDISSNSHKETQRLVIKK